MIEFLGSIASILGLSVTLRDKYKKSYGDKTGEIIGFLVALSKNSSALKNIHTKYHSLYFDLSQLDIYLRSPARVNIYKSYAAVDAEELLNKINSPGLQNASNTIHKALVEDVKILTKLRNETNLEILKEISKRNSRITLALSKIVNCQNEVIEIHSGYCDFFQRFKEIQNEKEISEESYAFIVSQKNYLSINFNTIINQTDFALMNYLELNNEVLSLL